MRPWEGGGGGSGSSPTRIAPSEPIRSGGQTLLLGPDPIARAEPSLSGVRVEGYTPLRGPQRLASLERTRGPVYAPQKVTFPRRFGSSDKVWLERSGLAAREKMPGWSSKVRLEQ